MNRETPEQEVERIKAYWESHNARARFVYAILVVAALGAIVLLNMGKP